MDDFERRIQAATRKRERTKAAFDSADEELRKVMVEARAAGMGPSQMARLTGFTREWAAKIAPEPKG